MKRIKLHLFVFYLMKMMRKTTDQQKALKCDFIYNVICSSRKKGFRHLFIFTIKYLTNTDVPARLAHFLRSASIF